MAITYKVICSDCGKKIIVKINDGIFTPDKCECGAIIDSIENTPTGNLPVVYTHREKEL